jgi:hypothetical protein
VQVALRDADDDGRALLEVHVRPLVWFVWLGPLLLAAACAKAAFAGALPRRSDEQLHDRSLTA